MADKIEWVWKVVDMATSPLKLITGGLEKAAHAADNAHESLEKLGGGKGLEMAVTKAELLAHGIEAAVDAATELVKKAGEAVYEFAKMGTEAMAFKEVNLSALEVLTGSRSEAQQLFKDFAQMHLTTPWKTSDIVEQGTKLMSAGLKGQKLKDTLMAVSDVAAMSGVDKNVMDRLAFAFAEVNSFGHLAHRQLNMIAIDGARAGIGFEQIAGALAKVKGVGKEAVEGLIHAGLIKPDEFFEAYTNAVKERYGGLGHASEMKGFGTVKGLWSTLQSTFENAFLLQDEDTKKSKGLQAMEGAMRNLVMLLNMGTASGKAFGNAIYEAWNKLMVNVFGDFSGEEGMKKLQHTFEKVLTVVENVGDIISGPLVEGAKAFLTAMLGGEFTLGEKLTPEKLQALTNSAKELGTELGELLVLLKDIVKESVKALRILMPGAYVDSLTPEQVQAKKDEVPKWMQHDNGLDRMIEKALPLGPNGWWQKLHVHVTTDGPPSSLEALKSGAKLGVQAAVPMATGAN